MRRIGWLAGALALGLGLLSAGPSPARGAMDLKEGLWEITSKVEMRGIPIPMPATTVRQCIRKEDPVPRGEEKNDCKQTKRAIRGNTVTWEIECATREGTSRIRGEVTYRGDAFDGKVRVSEAGSPGGEEILQKLHGKRIGDCPKTK
ncbi:MAG: hypothetical protein Kow00128_18130 [Deltaproteobacteria bacterium]